MSIDNATPEEWYAAHMATLNAKLGLTVRDIDGINTALARAPFGELPLMTRAYVFLLHQTGKIEMLVDNDPTHCPRWLAGLRYQVRAVEKPKTKPSIDWSQIKPEYKWLARDSDGTAWIYSTKPDCGGAAWDWRDNCTKATFMTSYEAGDCDWKDSLVERPA